MYRTRPRSSSRTARPTMASPSDARVKVRVNAKDCTRTDAHHRIRSRRTCASMANPAVTMMVSTKMAPRKFGEIPSVPAIRPGTSK